MSIQPRASCEKWDHDQVRIVRGNPPPRRGHGGLIIFANEDATTNNQSGLRNSEIG
jgi:hypothetical protein